MARAGSLAAQVAYSGAHRRVYRTRGAASTHTCSCGARASHWSYLGGATDERRDEKGRPFSGDPSFYVARCVPCHKRDDLAANGFTPAPCGTEKGYERHRREGTARCGPCKTAHTLAEAVRKAARTTSKGGGSNLVQG